MARRHNRYGDNGQTPKTAVEGDGPSLTVRIPCDTTLTSYAVRHIDAALTQEEAEVLERIRQALHRRHATMQPGGHVDSTVDALRWVLRHMHDASAPE